MSTDSRRIIGAETALAVLIVAMQEELVITDRAWTISGSDYQVDAVFNEHLRPRWRVTESGEVEFWLEEAPRSAKEGS
jgi:hypothetical protein